jgi:murein DD-endopeptidase MepM/ murein hydrolase activator NlpD
MRHEPRLGRHKSPLSRLARAAIALVVAASGPAAWAQTAAPKPRIADVEWPREGPVSASAGGPAFDNVDNTLLPVLVPRRLLDLADLSFVGEPLTYSVSAPETLRKRPGSKALKAWLSITGTRVAFDVTDPASAAAAGIVTEVTEKGASASVVRYGAAYKVDIECEESIDERCLDASDAKRLLESVTLVGGGRGSPPVPPTFPAPELPKPGAPASAAALPDGWASPPGALAPRSGTGVSNATVYAPGIRFPIEIAPAYLNSQVYGVGGQFGLRGGWSDARNYRYPWRDNFCEKRGYATPTCPSGHGHQGQDIRPSTHADKTYWAVAVENGRISRIGSYSVVLIGASGTEYRYLHLEMRALAVRPGQRVTKGQHLGLVSNDFGKTSTTVHLHFEMLQNIAGRGLRHVPPYTSLVAAYQAL